MPGEGEAFFFHLRAGTTELAAPSFTPRFKLGVASGADAASGSAARSLAFSAAEAVVNSDSEYQQYLAEQRQAVRGRIIARGVYDAAVAKARLMVGSV